MIINTTSDDRISVKNGRIGDNIDRIRNNVTDQ